MDPLFARPPRSQIEELPLFRPADPFWLTQPEGKLEHRFAAFHKAHPEIYAQLEAKMLELHRAGERYVGIGYLAELLRRRSDVEKHEEFKVNNSYRAFYARLLLFRHPELEGVIHVREQRHQRSA